MKNKGFKIALLALCLCIVTGLCVFIRQNTGVIVRDYSVASDAGISAGGDDTEPGEEIKIRYYLVQNEMGEYYFTAEKQNGNYFGEIEHDNVILCIDTTEYISALCPVCGESLLFGDGGLM